MIPFKYSRKKEIIKKDEQGNSIPLYKEIADESGVAAKEVIPGKFETEFVWRTDTINLDIYIRSHELEDGRVIVLLNDGHVEEQKIPTGLKNAKKGPVQDNIIYQKQVQWVQSEIILEKPEEIAGLYHIMDQILTTKFPN